MNKAEEFKKDMSELSEIKKLEIVRDTFRKLGIDPGFDIDAVINKLKRKEKLEKILK